MAWLTAESNKEINIYLGWHAYTLQHIVAGPLHILYKSQQTVMGILVQFSI